MTLVDFLSKHGKKLGYLEKSFLVEVFYADYGESGLDLIEPEIEIHRNDGSGRVWRLDFVVKTSSNKYAIECDGFSYHAPGMVSKERFNDLESKRNETLRQGYKLVSLSRDQIISEPQEAIFELRRSFNSDLELYSLFLHWNKDSIQPHDVQKEALVALQKTRSLGNKRGLVVLATGLGKTYLAILDAKALNSKRILFIVHVDHILKQAQNSFEKVIPARIKEMGFFTGKDKSYLDDNGFVKNIIFSTIQTLHREQNRAVFDKNYFDYIVIDESHHTAAESYRKIVDYFEPTFFLGLTATPDRMDEKSILNYYDNNLVYSMSQAEAIKRGYLAKLHYKGFLDNVDYSDIYYNGFRYDIADLNKNLMIEKRDIAIISKFKELAKNKKTIGFCVSIDHANWCAEQFRNAGIDAIAIHSKIIDKNTEGAYQSASEIIEAFDKGQHQVAFVVDMLNEGVDIPDVECILMLRPTESDVVLTQQLGRGLRLSDGKEGVLVLDFIGNYRTAPKILTGLGIQNINELKKDNSKNIYYYDNNGKYVEFESSVVEDIFKFIISRSTREIQTELITEEWVNYGDYLSNITRENENLYWSVGKKNNDLALHLVALDFINSNKNNYLTNNELDLALKNHINKVSPDRTMEGIRALFLSKIIGLVVDTYPFELSKAYTSISKYTSLQDNKAKDLVSNQFEKYYFYNDIFSLVNRHAAAGDRRKVNELFHIYPIFFLYQVLLRLRDRGYENIPLSKLEIEHFVLLARTHSDLQECVDRICNYRNYQDKYELEKFLNRKSTMDSRFYKTLRYISCLIYTEESINLKDDYISAIEKKVELFNQLSDSGKLIEFEENNPKPYKDMLFSDKDLISYHN